MFDELSDKVLAFKEFLVYNVIVSLQGAPLTLQRDVLIIIWVFRNCRGGYPYFGVRAYARTPKYGHFHGNFQRAYYFPML
jgi:hypothetical protein